MQSGESPGVDMRQPKRGRHRSRLAVRAGFAFCLLAAGLALYQAGVTPWGHHHLSAGRDFFHFHFHAGSHSHGDTQAQKEPPGHEHGHEHEHAHGHGHGHGHGAQNASPKPEGEENENGENGENGESSRFVGLEFTPPIPASPPSLPILGAPSYARTLSANSSPRSANLRAVRSRGPPSLPS